MRAPITAARCARLEKYRAARIDELVDAGMDPDELDDLCAGALSELCIDLARRRHRPVLGRGRPVVPFAHPSRRSR